MASSVFAPAEPSSAVAIVTAGYREVAPRRRPAKKGAADDDDAGDDKMLGGFQRNVQTLGNDLAFLTSRHPGERPGEAR